jgi:protease-4
MTENTYTREHEENVKNIVESIDQQVREKIIQARMPALNDTIWSMVREQGTLTANHAREIGFIDYLPTLNPLTGLLYANESEKAKTEMKEKWGKETDFENFTAVDSVTLTDYNSLLAKRKKLEERKWSIYRYLKHLSEKSTATKFLLSIAGYKAPYFNFAKDDFVKEKATTDKIALVNVIGTINDAVARRTLFSLRKINKEKDVKCVILRVDSPGGSITASESILQECRDMPQVRSFSLRCCLPSLSP